MTRVLALIPGGLSEQLLFFPTLDQLDQHYAQLQLDVVVEPKAKGAYRISPIVDKVFTFNFSGRTGPADWGNLIGVGRDREYDAVFYTGNSAFMGYLLWLMGIPERLTFAGSGSDFLYSTAVTRAPKKYVADQNHDLLQPLGIEGPCPALQIAISDHDRAWADAECQRLRLNPDQGFGIIHGGIHPRATATDTYPINSWVSLVKGIQERRSDLPLIVISEPNNAGWSASLLEQTQSPNTSTPKDLGKLAALIERAAVLICPDSAPMHLGVAVQTKVIALFGAGKPERLLPESEHYIGLKSPTGNIANISPIQVLEKLM